MGAHRFSFAALSISAGICARQTSVARQIQPQDTHISACLVKANAREWQRCPDEQLTHLHAHTHARACTYARERAQAHSHTHARARTHTQDTHKTHTHPPLPQTHTHTRRAIAARAPAPNREAHPIAPPHRSTGSEGRYLGHQHVRLCELLPEGFRPQAAAPPSHPPRRAHERWRARACVSARVFARIVPGPCVPCTGACGSN
jgi:hypothetical protein